MRFATMLRQLNERLAIIGTKWFSSMGTFWGFFCLGLLAILPILPASARTTILLISSAWIQLFSLPLIAVGSATLNRASEKRAKQDHEMLQQQLKQIADIQQTLQATIMMMRVDAQVNQELLDRLSKIDQNLDDLK
jgi:hypothetical protein